jgi:hypothetical protein
VCTSSSAIVRMRLGPFNENVVKRNLLTKGPRHNFSPSSRVEAPPPLKEITRVRDLGRLPRSHPLRGQGGRYHNRNKGRPLGLQRGPNDDPGPKWVYVRHLLVAVPGILEIFSLVIRYLSTTQRMACWPLASPSTEVATTCMALPRSKAPRPGGNENAFQMCDGTGTG